MHHKAPPGRLLPPHVHLFSAARYGFEGQHMQHPTHPSKISTEPVARTWTWYSSEDCFPPRTCFK